MPEHDAPVTESPSEGGARRNGEEIEVTDEMLAAGVEAYAFDPRFEDLEDALERAYRAMRLRER